MRTPTIVLLILAGSMNLLFANNALPVSLDIAAHNIVNVHLNMPIIGTENLATNVFYYDIVGLESDATATYLTSGVTKDVHALIADLKLNKNYTKIGIKLKWGETSKYYLFDRMELTYGQIDLAKGKE